MSTASENLRQHPDSLQGLPPGFAGEIARYLYAAAPRQHVEPAIVGTLGLLAGINGRAYTVSNPKMGINLYVMLVMETAMGKEAMFRIVSLHNTACGRYGSTWGGNIDNLKMMQKFVESDSAASMQGMRRRMDSDGAAFVNVLTELGQNIKEMAVATTESPAFQLKRLLLELFEKSGPHQVLGGIRYSKAENNIGGIVGPAVSIIGDTTPETFYSAMNTNLASDGFLSRWTIVECPSHVRPAWNKNAPEPSEELLLGLQWMMVAAAEMNRKEQRFHIECDQAAQALLDAFDKECDSSINQTRNATMRAAWSRSMAKAYRTAANLAVADYYGFCAWARHHHSAATPPPLMICQSHMEWAIQRERQNAQLLTARVRTGDIGDGDDTRRAKLRELITECLTSRPLTGNWEAVAGPLRDKGIVPYSWLQMRTQRMPAFSGEREKSTLALKRTIYSLVDAGDLKEVDNEFAAKMNLGLHIRGKAYLCMSLPQDE